ncbi:MAG: RNA chaperone Hfq [Clostridioides sp.]|jgi:host factor-I protein|nr:RNA chaperone Hfq [Clostridioides sp.]
MKGTVLNLQDLFLNTLRKEKIPAEISLLDGTIITGMIKGFDSYIILVDESDRTQRMVYKHALSSIKPSRYILLGNNNQNR